MERHGEITKLQTEVDLHKLEKREARLGIKVISKAINRPVQDLGPDFCFDGSQLAACLAYGKL